MSKKKLLSFCLVLLFLSFSAAGQVDLQLKKNHLSFDHFVIVVDNLQSSVNEFQTLAFQVYSGGKPAGNFDHNAIIPLSDGTYIELYAALQAGMQKNLEEMRASHSLERFTQGLDVMNKRFVTHIAKGAGFADFALLVKDNSLQHEIEWLKSKGLNFAGPIKMSRVNPQHQELVWYVGVTDSYAMPFLIQDETPRSWRSDSNKAKTNANIDSITIVVKEMSAAIEQYQTLLGANVVNKKSTAQSSITEFKIGDTKIILIAPTKKPSEYLDFLNTHGEGMYYLHLRCAGHKPYHNEKLRVSIN